MLSNLGLAVLLHLVLQRRDTCLAQGALPADGSVRSSFVCGLGVIFTSRQDIFFLQAFLEQKQGPDVRKYQYSASTFFISAGVLMAAVFTMT